MANTRITSQDILDGTILNQDISTSAGIDPLKIGSNASGVTSGNFAFLSGVGSQVDGISDIRTLQFKTITGTNNNVAAKYFLSATGIISITGNSPSSGQVLVAQVGGSTAQWQTPGGGLSIANFIFNEVPIGTVNGIADSFRFANSVTSTGTVRLYKNGMRQLPNPTSGVADYFFSGLTGVVFNAGNLPQTNDVILVDYMI